MGCEGCGLCALGCLEGTITMKDAISGELFISETRHGPMVHARLGIGEDNSGKLVAEVRKLAYSLAEQRGLELIIIDGPPGVQDAMKDVWWRVAEAFHCL
jgi:MinD superfamily P-loop ATPase